VSVLGDGCGCGVGGSSDGDVYWELGPVDSSQLKVHVMCVFAVHVAQEVGQPDTSIINHHSSPITATSTRRNPSITAVR
jgi:hypothetical protein